MKEKDKLNKAKKRKYKKTKISFLNFPRLWHSNVKGQGIKGLWTHTKKKLNSRKSTKSRVFFPVLCETVGVYGTATSKDKVSRGFGHTQKLNSRKSTKSSVFHLSSHSRATDTFPPPPPPPKQKMTTSLTLVQVIPGTAASNLNPYIGCTFQVQYVRLIQCQQLSCLWRQKNCRHFFLRGWGVDVKYTTTNITSK